MRCFLTFFLTSTQALTVRSSESSFLWSLDGGDTSGSDTSLSLPDQEGSPFLSDDSYDTPWDLNLDLGSDALPAFENVQLSDPILSLDKLASTGSDVSILGENSADDSPSVDDFLLSGNECPDPSDILVGRSQARSTSPNKGICNPHRRISPPLNIPSHLRLEDVQRVPGFVPVFRGMSDSCIVYSDGVLPLGVCSSTEPEDTILSGQRFHGLLTWQLAYCTIGKFSLSLLLGVWPLFLAGLQSGASTIS